MSTPPNDLSSTKIRSRNPLLLNAAQEGEVRDIYYKRVRSKCTPEIKAFADCARGRTFTIGWSCRGPRRTMNTCMLAYANQDEKDAAREQWFETTLKKAQEKKEKERQKELDRPLGLMVPARSSSELK